MNGVPDIEIKLENMDDMMEDDVSYNRQDNPMNSNETLHLQSLINMSRELADQESCTDFTMMAKTKDWSDEMNDYSTHLVRETRDTLGRIQHDFIRRGMKFNGDFRNHFLYVINNRLREAFDAFLLELPFELKNDDCPVNRVPVPKQQMVRRSMDKNGIINQTQKRSCIDNEPTQIMKDFSGFVNISKTIPKPMPKTNSSLSFKKIVSKVTEQSTSTTLNGKTVNHSSQITARRLEQVQRANPLKGNSTEGNGRSAEKQKCRLVLIENNKLSNASLSRRKSIANPMVLIPTLHISKVTNLKETSSSTVKMPVKEITNETTKATPNILRRKTCADKETFATSTEFRKLQKLPLKLQASQQHKSDQKQQPLRQQYQAKQDLKQQPQLLYEPKKKQQQQPPTKQEQKQQQKPNDEQQKLPKISLALTETTGVRTRSRRNTIHFDRTLLTHYCDMCPYTTEVRTNLERHKLTHSGIKPFKCNHCSKAFTQKINLKSHLKSNHRELHNDPKYFMV